MRCHTNQEQSAKHLSFDNETGVNSNPSLTGWHGGWVVKDLSMPRTMPLLPKPTRRYATETGETK